MKKSHRNQLVIAFLTLQVVFGIIFIFALVNFSKGRSLLGIPIPYTIENGIVMFFSFISMLNVYYELKNIDGVKKCPTNK